MNRPLSEDARGMATAAEANPADGVTRAALTDALIEDGRDVGHVLLLDGKLLPAAVQLEAGRTGIEASRTHGFISAIVNGARVGGRRIDRRNPAAMALAERLHPSPPKGVIVLSAAEKRLLRRLIGADAYAMLTATEGD